MIREVAYLQIPEGYFRGRGEVPLWSASGEAIEYPDGSTLALGAAVGLFLEGYALVGPLIHFAHVVDLFERLDPRTASRPRPGSGTGDGVGPWFRGAEPLIRAFRDAGRPIRNLGALSAWLCREVPPVADPPDTLELCLRLANGSLLSALAVQRWATSATAIEAEDPAIDAETFAVRFLGALGALTPEALAGWLRHGRGPMDDPGPSVAGGVDRLKPRSWEGTLAALEARERLAGAAPMVAQLVASLTLPPRRLAHRALPSGGYADVATRGRPEQILPSQFAIDDLEFLRRFAENELLYFHREEPHAPATEELVVVLDQGVRTWGRVRVALAASALAFGKLAGRRKIPLLVGTTGTDGRLVDPLAADPEALGALWEASDLTPDPALALEGVLEAKAGAKTRDVVVLSHPRSVAGPDFAAAAGRATPGTRVFSVAIDETGLVQFREWRRGVAVKLGDFRVDFDPPRPQASARPVVDRRGWGGDVEPVGFPFRFGVLHRIDLPLFDFDHAGRWLLVATHRGMLHLWALDGSRSETLPRGLVDGEFLEQAEAVLGVADGFVVGGRIGSALVAIHYDIASRTARAYPLGPGFEADWQWSYERSCHTVVARGRTYCRAVDLGTREVFRSRDAGDRPTSRTIRAFERANNHALPPPRVAVVHQGASAPDRGIAVRLDRDSGEVRLTGAHPPWEPFTPMVNGHPSLRGFWVDHAQLRGNVLALVISGPSRRGASLRLFHGPEGVPSRELPPADESGHFLLSPDGRLLARRLGERLVEVREVDGAGLPVFVTPKGKAHNDPKLALGRYGMILRVGKHGHLIRWDRGPLTVANLPDLAASPPGVPIRWPIDRVAMRSTPRPPGLAYDPRRFIACARAELTAVVDAYGQVALFDRRDRLLAMFLVFRSHVAAWMPDGTRFGINPLIDAPPTPDAAGIIGRALKAASDAGDGVERG